MDGRVQLPVIHWIKDNYSADYVDMITEAGMDGILSDACCNINSLLKKIDISLEKHNSNSIFIVGHYDCGGNIVSEETHREQICIAVENVKRQKPSVKVIGLWVSKEWTVEKIIERLIKE